MPVRPEDHTLDPVPQVGHVEVNQQADMNSAQAHVSQELRLMDWMNCVYTLDFHNHSVLDYEVHPKPQLDLLAFINHRQSDLRGNMPTTRAEFMSQTCLINALKQPRTKNRMDFHRGVDYRPSDLVDLRGCMRSCHFLYLDQAAHRNSDE
jgi:hypothetical protein